MASRTEELRIAENNRLLNRDTQTRRRKGMRYKYAITKTLRGSEPKAIEHWSDLHYGSDAAAIREWERNFAYILNTPNVYAAFYGDILEGFNPGHIGSEAQLTLPVTDQMLTFKDLYLLPLDEQKKVLFMLGWYTNSHLRAALKVAGIDLYPLLTHMTTIDLLMNGSLAHIKAGTATRTFRGYHNSPKSGNERNPTGGLKRSEVTAEGYADHIISGHLHTLGRAVSADKSPNGKVKYHYALGAFKGGNDEGVMPDFHAVANFGGRRSGPPGAATILYTDQNGIERDYGIGDIELSHLLFEASKLYGQILNSGNIEKYRKQIDELIGIEPEIVLNEERSETRIDEKTDIVPAKSYTTVTYDINTAGAPFLVMFVSNLRLNSRLANKTALNKIVNLVAKNSRSTLLVLRQMIDQDVPQHADRKSVVRDLIGLLKPAWEKGRIAGWLYDSILRYEYWKQPRDKVGRKYRDPNGYMPANDILDRAGVTLVDGHSEITFNFKRNGNSGKASIPFRFKIYDRTGTNKNSSFTAMLSDEIDSGFDTEGDEHDVLVGGDSVSAGWLQRTNPKTQADQTIIGPGWLSKEHNRGGKGYRSQPPRGGYGTILLPNNGEKRVVPVSTPEEAEYWFDALYFYTCLDNLGLLEQTKKELAVKS